MQRARWLTAALLLVAVGAAGWWLFARMVTERREFRPAPAAPAALNGTVLRFEAGAPQLSYLKIQMAEAFPEPVIEALAGRIAYDDDRTARVSAPLAGRVSRIEVQLGQKVAKGAVLAWLDAPVYAQAVADVYKRQRQICARPTSNSPGRADGSKLSARARPKRPASLRCAHRSQVW